MLAKYEPSKSKSSFNSNNSHNYQMDKFENRTPTLYNKGSSKANGRSFSSPKNNDFEFGNKGSSLLPRQNTFDPFQEMRNHQMQIFKEFDNLHKNVFGKFDEMFDIMPHKSLFKGFDSIEKEMKDLMSFSNVGSSLNDIHGPSKVITRSYVQSTKLDPNGNKYKEQYFSNNFAMRGSDGTKISESQQGYQNTNSKVQKIAEERMINDRGKKLVQERVIGGPVNRTSHYMNMDESHVPQFDKDWDHHTNKLGFYNEFGKMLGYDGTVKKVYYDDTSSQNSYQNGYPQKRGYTNDDPVILNEGRGFGRIKANDLQPTMPGRAVPMGNNERNRGGLLELEAPREQRDFREYEAPQRNVQPAENRGLGLRGDGNFRNKNVSNAMPRAG